MSECHVMKRHPINCPVVCIYVCNATPKRISSALALRLHNFPLALLYTHLGKCLISLLLVNLMPQFIAYPVTCGRFWNRIISFWNCRTIPLGFLAFGGASSL